MNTGLRDPSGTSSRRQSLVKSNCGPLVSPVSVTAWLMERTPVEQIPTCIAQRWRDHRAIKRPLKESAANRPINLSWIASSTSSPRSRLSVRQQNHLISLPEKFVSTIRSMSSSPGKSITIVPSRAASSLSCWRRNSRATSFDVVVYFSGLGESLYFSAAEVDDPQGSTAPERIGSVCV